MSLMRLFPTTAPPDQRHTRCRRVICVTFSPPASAGTPSTIGHRTASVNGTWAIYGLTVLSPPTAEEQVRTGLESQVGERPFACPAAAIRRGANPPYQRYSGRHRGLASGPSQGTSGRRDASPASRQQDFHDARLRAPRSATCWHHFAWRGQSLQPPASGRTENA